MSHQKPNSKKLWVIHPSKSPQISVSILLSLEKTGCAQFRHAKPANLEPKCGVEVPRELADASQGLWKANINSQTVNGLFFFFSVKGYLFSFAFL